MQGRAIAGVVPTREEKVSWLNSARRKRSSQAAAQSGAKGGLWVTSREAFWIALEALRTHKLRSFLTLLGVVIATATLIVVMSVINGMNLYIADHIANLGANVFIVHQFKWAQGYEAWLRARRRNQPIRIEDFEFLRDNLKGYKNIGAEAWMNSSDNSGALQRAHCLRGPISGETPNMIDIGQTKVEPADTSTIRITLTSRWCASWARIW